MAKLTKEQAAEIVGMKVPADPELADYLVQLVSDGIAAEGEAKTRETAALFRAQWSMFVEELPDDEL